MKNENGEIHKRHKNNKVKTLIIQGTSDEASSLDGFKSFVESSKDEYLEIPGADHNFTNASHREKVIKKALDWFNQNL